MRLLKKTIIMTGLAGLFALVAWIPLEAEADEGFIRRLTADFFNFDNTESFTNITAVAGPDENTPGDPDGEVIFKKRSRCRAAITHYTLASTLPEIPMGVLLFG